MTAFYLDVRAPFAAFRWLQAGVYRASSPVITPSAAWGLVCNLAGIETRAAGNHVVTPIRPDAPRFRLAVGRVGEAPEVATLYQQLHTYPVGNSGKELGLDVKAKGAKFWITPARREVLVDVHVVIGVEGDSALREHVRRGLAGTGDRAYGLPFLGDNNLLIDRLDLLDLPREPVSWFGVWDGTGTPRPGSCRLTVNIDRGDSSRTETPLFAPLPPQPEAPPTAWVEVGPPTGANVASPPNTNAMQNES